jgi:hypothetical protein
MQDREFTSLGFDPSCGANESVEGLFGLAWPAAKLRVILDGKVKGVAGNLQDFHPFPVV